MKTKEEFEAARAAYWRRLNEACGVPAGTHPDDPNPPRKARAHATAAHPARRGPCGLIPGNEQVHAALLHDPAFMALLHDHWSDTFVPNDIGPAPADKRQLLEWYTLRDLNSFHHKRHQADFEDAKKHRTAQRVEKLFSKLATCDPLFSGAMQMMRHSLWLMPHEARKNASEAFTRCPLETLDFYKAMRGSAQMIMRVNTRRRKRDGR